jgi:alpha-N-arabinofuranosidase
MTPEYYANEMRRYSTFTKNYGDNRLYKVACGPNVDDYHWMETLMKDGNPGRSFQGISLHYYTVCGDWGKKGSATQFDEKEYFTTMKKTLFMDELLQKHIQIMDKYDPNNRVGLIVDEWGNWHDVEPGTNPGFLYQQNTLRDALVASVNLDLFNKYARRVKMANIAQTVNVLQAMILTNETQIVKTPSFYVFKMYMVHHDATLLPSNITGENYTFGTESVPALSATASKDASGKIHVTITNLNPSKNLEVSCDLKGMEKVSFGKGSIVTGEKINSYNDFGKNEEITLKAFSDVKTSGSSVTVNVPAKSVVMLELN